MEFSWDFLLIFEVEEFQEAFPGNKVQLHECHFIGFLDKIGCVKLQLELPTHQDSRYDLLRQKRFNSLINCLQLFDKL